ncbi:unnamed protein product [Phytophthora lilii]|uniref:Unnamed protein product n=1 Tax=Phytophthora lilii TaxID=2077276 RepID=A0A9W6YF29_9STRA|nr:unnamed protein product [Phytophthora lilii]
MSGAQIQGWHLGRRKSQQSACEFTKYIDSDLGAEEEKTFDLLQWGLQLWGPSKLRIMRWRQLSLNCGVETQLRMDMPVAAEVPNGGKLPGRGLKDSLVTDLLIFIGPDVSKSTPRVT